MQACKESAGCTQSTQAKQLDKLKDTCLNDANCIAVSCYNLNGDGGKCRRYMLSDSCDETTINEQKNWNIHLLDSGNVKKNTESLRI